MKVWIVTANSESGDDYGVWVFAKKPSDEKLKKLFMEQCAAEFEDCEDGEEADGPGKWGSYLHVSGPTETEVI